MEPEAGEKAPSRLVLLVQNRTGYLNLCELLSRGWLENAGSGHALIKWAWLTELGDGPDRAVGRRQRLARPGAARRRRGARARAGRAPAARVSGSRFYLEVQRIGLPGNEAHLRAAVELAARARACRSSRRTRAQFLAPDDHEAHEARVCVAEGEMLANPRRVKRFTPRAVLQVAGADGGAVRRPAERARQHGRDRQALQPEPGARQAAAARLRDAAVDGAACRCPSTSGSRRTRGSRRGWRSSTPIRRCASASGRATSSGSTSRSRRS